MGFRQITGFAGIATVLVGAIAVFFPANGDYPTIASPGKDIASFYARNRDVAVITSLLGAGLLFLIVVFAAGVYQTLRDAERPRGEGWSLIGLLGATAMSVTYVIAIAPTVALTVGSSDLAGQDALVRALYLLGNAVGSLGGAFAALYLVGFGIAILRTGALPAWTGWLGLVAAALSLIGVPAAVAAGPWAAIGYVGGIGGFLLWTLVVAVWMVRSVRPMVVRAPA